MMTKPLIVIMRVKVNSKVIKIKLLKEFFFGYNKIINHIFLFFNNKILHLN